MKRILYLAVFLLMLGSFSFGAAICDMRIGAGIRSSKFVGAMGNICAFLQRAEEKRRTFFPDSPELSILSGGPLAQLKNEGFDVIMVVGRSADFAADGSEEQRKRDAELEILSALNRFDKTKTVFLSGGTDSGDIGVFHEMAVKRGFRVVGVSALDAAKYKPALMTDFYVEFGEGFGAESVTAVKNSSALLMLGGGAQAARESILADLNGIPVYIVNNILFNEKRMKSAEVAEALAGSKLSKSFQSAAEAADAMTHFQKSSVINSLPPGSIDLNVADLKSIYNDKFFLGFSTWAMTEMPEESVHKFRKYVQNLLEKLDPKKTVLVTAGTIYGGEGIVAEIASRMGFEIIGAPVSEGIKSEMFSKHIKKYVITGKNWETRNMFFTSLLDGLVVAGKSSTLAEHLKSSSASGKPTFNVEGFNLSMDVYSNNLKSGINFSDVDIDRVISEMEKSFGGQLRKSNSYICLKFYGGI